MSPPPLFAGKLPILEAVSLSSYFKTRNLPIFGNIKVIVYENDMRKNSSFLFTNFWVQLEIYM